MFGWMLTTVGSSIQKSKAVSGWITNAAALTAAATQGRLEWLTKPASTEASGIIVVELQPNVRVGLQFVGYDAADPNNTTATGRAWLVGEHGTYADAKTSEGHGIHAFDVAITIGNTIIGTTNSLHPGGTNVAKWADTAVVTNDHTVGGVYTSGATAGVGNDCAVELTFDNASKRFLVLELTLNGSTLDGIRPIVRQY
jgi:hypothetical protein